MNKNRVAAQISIIDHDEPLTPTFLVGPFTGNTLQRRYPLSFACYAQAECLIKIISEPEALIDR